jgi:AcrR family transcriptional regulator
MEARRRLLPRAERQEAILRSAAGAFSTTGFTATSMEDVAAASGVTRLILYRHFNGKEDLYRAVLVRVTERLEEEFLAGVRGHRRAIGLTALLTVAREDPEGFRLLWRHAAREPQFAAYADEQRERAVALARPLVAQSSLDPALTEWAAQLLVASLVQAVLHWLDHGAPDRDGEFVELVTHGVEAQFAAWLEVDESALTTRPGAASRRG